MNCPHCNTYIPTENTLVTTGMATCPVCHNGLTESSQSSQTAFKVSQVPYGMRLHTTPHGYIIQSHNRQTRGVVVVSGILFVLALLACWFATVLFSLNHDAKLPMVAFLLVFFLIVSLPAWQYLFGEISIEINQQEGKITQGFPLLGWVSVYCFEWQAVAAIKEQTVTRIHKGHSSQYTHLVIEAQKRIIFGRYLSDARKYYLLRTLQHCHQQALASGRISIEMA